MTISIFSGAGVVLEVLTGFSGVNLVLDILARGMSASDVER